MPDLNRFLNAQNSSYQQAEQELTQGAKTSHWIWYIFPQLKGLGQSYNSQFYGIADLDEACEYLAHPLLNERYLNLLRIVKEQLEKGISGESLMGGNTDLQKLISSLTLFKESARKSGFTEIQTLSEDILKALGNKLCSATQKQISDKPIKIEVKASPTFFKSENTTKNSEPNNIEPLKSKLKVYISQRKKEWSYHYNFLGFVHLLYWLQDTFSGTDYLNTKSKKVKLSAAEGLLGLLEGKEHSFTKVEQEALKDKRLGKIISEHGGLEEIIKAAEKEPLVDLSNRSKSV